MQNPIVFTALLPLALSAALCVLVLLTLRGAAARAMTSGAVGISFGIAAVLILGWPLLPPAGATHKSMVLALIAVSLGIVLAVRPAARIVRGTFLLLWLVGLAWLSQRLLPGERWWQVALTGLVGVAVLMRLERTSADGIVGAGQIVLCAIGLSIIALHASSASIAQSAGALAAACGGLMLVNWPRVRLPVAATTLLPATFILTLLAAQTVLFTAAPAWAVVALLVVFAVPPAMSRVVTHRSLSREVWLPVLLVVIGSIPVATVALLLRAASEPVPTY